MSKPIATLAVAWFCLIALWGGIAAPSWVVPGRHQLADTSEIVPTVLVLVVLLPLIGWFLPRACGAWSVGFAVGGVIAFVMALAGGKNELLAGLALAVAGGLGVAAFCIWRWNRKAVRAGLHPWTLAPNHGGASTATPEASKHADEYAARFRSDVPLTYPDGTPYLALEAYDAVAKQLKTLMRHPGPDSADLVIYHSKVLALMAGVTDSRTHTISGIGEAHRARQLLLEAALIHEERVLSKALMLVLQYHERAGHIPA